MSRLIDLTGKRFGYLTVLQKDNTKNGVAYWLCKCDCGNKKAIKGQHLKSGNTLSCGCMHRKYSHGQSNTRLYHIWRTMKARCFDSNSLKYSRYGGRGITMCEDWKNSFVPFYNWAMENGYDESLSIDRIDNNGGYFPQNCRWATPKEQANNTSKNVVLEYNGESGTLSQMANKYGLKPTIVSKRLKRGWTIEKALNTPRITKYFGSTGM